MLKSRQSFTLIELLVVLAIVAILSVVVILTLNPSELLKQARDSNRLSDLGTLNTALAAYSADMSQGFMGTSSVVYVSIPDTSPTCDNLGLPTSTGAGFTYHCVTSQNLKNSDGTGWIPVNFSQISFGSPISSLPVDPINTTSSGNYYTYVSGGSFILTAIPESAKQKTALSSNPNISNYPGVIATGNNLSLSPLYNPSGLVGYWKFDGDAIDSSGYGNHGVWNGTSTERYATGKVGSYAGQFNGINDYVSCNGDNVLKIEGNLTISVWAYFNQFKDYGYIVLKTTGGGNIGVNYRMMSGATNINGLIANGSASNVLSSAQTANGISVGNWVFLTFAADGDNLKFYVDGKLKFSAVQNITPVGSSHTMNISNSTNGIDGNLDDVRIYNRALSAAEVSALYNATK